MNYFEWENKYMNWITNHKFTYDFLIVLVGLILGYVGNLFLGGSGRQGMIMAFFYSTILLFTDLGTWGTE